jgi:hypothetical protein
VNEFNLEAKSLHKKGKSTSKRVNHPSEGSIAKKSKKRVNAECKIDYN